MAAVASFMAERTRVVMRDHGCARLVYGGADEGEDRIGLEALLQRAERHELRGAEHAVLRLVRLAHVHELRVARSPRACDCLSARGRGRQCRGVQA